MAKKYITFLLFVAPMLTFTMDEKYTIPIIEKLEEYKKKEKAAIEAWEKKVASEDARFRALVVKTVQLLNSINEDEPSSQKEITDQTKIMAREAEAIKQPLKQKQKILNERTWHYEQSVRLVDTFIQQIEKGDEDVRGYTAAAEEYLAGVNQEINEYIKQWAAIKFFKPEEAKKDH